MATAQLQYRVNGGALHEDSIEVSSGDVISLTAGSFAGWGQPAARWEIVAFPPDWPAPAGWSTDASSGAYYYLANTGSSGVTPPNVTIPDPATYWGKWLFRLTVNGTVISSKIGVETISPNLLLHDMALGEGRQWGGTRGYVGDHQDDLRKLDDASFVVGGYVASLTTSTPLDVDVATGPVTLSWNPTAPVGMGGFGFTSCTGVANAAGAVTITAGAGALTMSGSTTVSLTGATAVSVSAGTGAVTCTGGTAAAGSVEEVLGITREVTAAAAGTIGTGARIAFRTRDGAGTPALSVIATERAALTAVAGANLSAKLVWATVNVGALTDWMTLLEDGALRLHAYTTEGFLSTTAAGVGDVATIQPRVLCDGPTDITPNARDITNLGTTLGFSHPSGIPATFTRFDASDNSMLDVLELARYSSGGPGVIGIGAAFRLKGWHDGEDAADIAQIGAAMTNVGAATYAASLRFWAATGGALAQVGTWATGASGLRLHYYGTGILHSDASGNITSSAIVNADVDAAAAIAGTKIDPSFGNQTIVNTSRIETTRVVSDPSTPASSGGAVTLNLTTSQNVYHATTENTTVTISGGTSGQHGVIVVSQGVSGKTITMPTNGTGVEYDNTIAALTTTGIIDTTASTRTLLAYYVLPNGRAYIYARSVDTIP